MFNNNYHYPGSNVKVLVVRLVRLRPSRNLYNERDHIQNGQQEGVEKFLKFQQFNDNQYLLFNKYKCIIFVYNIQRCMYILYYQQ